MWGLSADVFRFVLGLIFIGAGVQKALDPAAFRDAVRRYEIVPAALITEASAAVVATELALGGLLLAGLWPRAMVASGAAVLGSFTVLISFELVTGRRIPCGCFGGSGRMLSRAVAIEDGLLALAASVYALAGDYPAGGGFRDYGLPALMIAAALLLSYQLLSASETSSIFRTLIRTLEGGTST